MVLLVAAAVAQFVSCNRLLCRIFQNWQKKPWVLARDSLYLAPNVMENPILMYHPPQPYIKICTKYRYKGTHASDGKMCLISVIHLSKSDHEQDQFNAKCWRKKAMLNKVFCYWINKGNQCQVRSILHDEGEMPSKCVSSQSSLFHQYHLSNPAVVPCLRLVCDRWYTSLSQVSGLRCISEVLDQQIYSQFSGHF